MGDEHAAGRPTSVPPDGERVPRPDPFVTDANVREGSIRATFASNWPDCWSRAAGMLDWERPHDAVLSTGGNGNGVEWFPGGRLNAAHNCVDRHVEAGRKNKAAIRWEGTAGESRTYTYLDLYREVNETAAALRDLGVGPGDTVTLCLPMIPELITTMLACVRLGALHNVVFAGLSARELADRIERTDSSYLVTCDGYYRRGAAVNLKSKADNARHDADREVTTVVVDRLPEDVHLTRNHLDFRELVGEHAGERVDPVTREAADPLFVIATSGTTGESDQVVHTTGGYLSYVTWTGHAVLDVTPEDTCWCTADISWITGHSYVAYGPLSLGATTLLYEGVADLPEKRRVWGLVERHAVDVFYTAPTMVRAFMKWGEEYPREYDLSSLRLLGTVGEPIDPATWRWYHDHVGGGRCPVVDTWWQTETGGILVSTLPGVDAMRPGAAGPPLPGIEVAVVDENGNPVPPGEQGYLAVTRPWPAMPLSIARSARSPLSAVDGERNGDGHSNGDDDLGWAYVTGDRALRDEDGYVVLLGRDDDTLSVDGRAIGTATLESALIGTPGVVEAAVVEPDGAGVVAYVTTRRDQQEDDDLREQIRGRVASVVGLEGCPKTIVFTPELPKTHSGKIMRRLLVAIAEGTELGDISALRNPETVGEIETVTRQN